MIYQYYMKKQPASLFYLYVLDGSWKSDIWLYDAYAPKVLVYQTFITWTMIRRSSRTTELPTHALEFLLQMF